MADISSITLPGGGTYNLKDKNAVPRYGKGKNLLRNWYFIGGGTGRGVFPVNQRGKTSYGIVPQYTIDGWHASYGSGGVNVVLNQTGVSIAPVNTSSYGIFECYIESEVNSLLAGKKITATVLMSNGDLLTGTITVPASSFTRIMDTIYNSSILRVAYDSANGFLRVDRYNSAIEMAAIKLELGTEQTLAHQENGVWVLNEVPDYEYELYRCITSTADPSDTYANKSLATRQDLTSIQATGTTNTTGSAIPAGTYFYLNGVLYQAKTQIDVNATFTVNTNCKQATEGGLNQIAPKLLMSEWVTGMGDYSIASLRFYNLFIVRIIGNDVNFRTLVVSPGVSTQINVDATASIYVRMTILIDYINLKVSVTNISSATWTGGTLQVWGVALPV